MRWKLRCKMVYEQSWIIDTYMNTVVCSHALLICVCVCVCVYVNCRSYMIIIILFILLFFMYIKQFVQKRLLNLYFDIKVHAVQFIIYYIPCTYICGVCTCSFIHVLNCFIYMLIILMQNERVWRIYMY